VPTTMDAEIPGCQTLPPVDNVLAMHGDKREDYQNCSVYDSSVHTHKQSLKPTVGLGFLQI